MPEYSFTVVIDGDVDARLNDLFDAGCDDATFGAVDGVHYGDFDRTAPTFSQAITSALTAIESVEGLRIIRVEPDDLVTAADIAERLGRTRESVRLLIAGARGPGGFPAPVWRLRTRNRLWRWSDVAAWAKLDTTLEANARLVAAVNAALELRRVVTELPEDERSFVASLEHARAS